MQHIMRPCNIAQMSLSVIDLSMCQEALCSKCVITSSDVMQIKTALIHLEAIFNVVLLFVEEFLTILASEKINVH